MAAREQDEFDVDDWEDPDESDMDDDDGDDADPETVPCPYCRAPVSEEAELCPHCGNFILRDDVRPRKPWWLVAGTVVCLLIVLLWVMS